MRSPQMIGVEPLNAGIGNFHAIFSVALQVVGRPVSELTPFSVGPRQFGQSAERATVAARHTHITDRTLRISELPGYPG